MGAFLFPFFPVQAEISWPQIMQTLEEKRVYEERAWEKILFFRYRYFSKTGLFDDPAYYLDKEEGRYDLKAEMVASLKALLSPEEIDFKGKKIHPRCIFTARAHYLFKRFKIEQKDLPKVNCVELEKYRQFTDYEGISLVFSDYFINNPASMFGHTLFRLHRNYKNPLSSGQLDDAINFAAHVPHMNPLTYPFQGLLGLFNGQFSLVPYSQKIQEYNNSESRDLWEYRLNLSKEDMKFMELLLWEVGFFYMRYFYLDENCSFILLSFLEAIRPELKLSGGFWHFAIPGDTLKAVRDIPGLIKEVHFRPSSLSRYLMRIKTLSSSEKRTFKSIFSEDDPQEIIKKVKELECSKLCKANIIDTGLELIDYKEKVTGNKKDYPLHEARTKLLVQRSKLGVRVNNMMTQPEETRPDRGHKSSVIEIRPGIEKTGEFTGRLRMRPAIHGLENSNIGQAKGLKLHVFDTQIRYEGNFEKVSLEKFSFIELLSLGSSYPLIPAWSWGLSLMTENVRYEKDPKLYNRTVLRFNYGKTFELFRGFRFYLLASVDGGKSQFDPINWRLSYGGLSGFIWDLSDQVKFLTNVDFTKVWRSFDYENWRANSQVNYYWNSGHETYLDVTYKDEITTYGIGHRFFY